VHYTTSCNTQSSAPEVGRDHCPKHVEPIGIINKPLLLHLVGVYIIYIYDARSIKYQIDKKNGEAERAGETKNQNTKFYVTNYNLLCVYEYKK